MIAVILAAGKSTRLQPLTDAMPKPMLPVAGIPNLEHVVRYLRSHGVVDIIITTHYRSERISRYFGDGSRFGVKIQYAHEKTLMDTAGSLKLSQALLREDFLVVGGNDLLPTLNLGNFYRFHLERGGVGSIVFKHLADQELVKLFGQGKLDQTHRLVEFHEKPSWFVSNLVHTTYQCYSPRVLDFVPPQIPYSIPSDLIPRLLAAGERVYGYVTDSEFICISTPEMYRQANELMTRMAVSNKLRRKEC